MEEKLLVVHEPEVGETLRHYLQRYTSDQRDRIYEHKTKSIEFSAKLLNTAWAYDSKQESIEKGLENLWKILDRLRNFRPFLHFVKVLEPGRRHLLETLDNYEEIAGKISNWFIAGRILSSFADIAGTLGDLYLVGQPQSNCESWAIHAAKLSGFFGLACSFSKVKLSSDAFKDLMKRFEKDKENVKQIQSWYEQCSELEEEMKNIFPFDRTNKIVDEFIAIVENMQPSPEELLSKLLKTVKDLSIGDSKASGKENEQGTVEKVKQESVEEVEEESAKNIAQVSVKNNNPSSTNDDEIRICERLICLIKNAGELGVSLYAKRNWLEYYILKTANQEDSVLSFYSFQFLAAVAPRSRLAYSVPRLAFNFFSMYDGIRSIWSFKDHKADIEKLRIQLKGELTTLRKIADFIMLKSDGLLL